AAVEAAVSLSAGHGRQVTVRSRAGVRYTASLPVAGFRPVAVGGLRGAAAAVAAAEAQIGWPYVWGGESRAEGGFDCSGLVDYAYAAAGHPLLGRPTAADLFRLAQPVARSQLLPGDLVFVGSAGGAPHHVGIYVGGGTVVAAPHTGAAVSYQPLTGGGWDGYGRLIEGGPAVPAATAVDLAARRWQVPPNVLAAALGLGLVPGADAGGRAIAAAQARRPEDLAGALADALGSPSRAALVLRAASGPVGSRFTGSVRLLPVDGSQAAGTEAQPAELRWGWPSAVPAPGARSPAGRPGTGVGTAVQAGSNASELAGRVAETAGERLSGLPRLPATLRHVGRGVMTLVAVFAPDRRIADLASFAGAAWDCAASVSAALARAPAELGPLPRLAGGLGIAGGALAAVAGAAALAHARSTRGRVRAGAMLTGGLMVSGGGVLAAGLVVAAVPPLGFGLIAAGTAISAGLIVYDHWDGITAATRRTLTAAGSAAASAAGTVRDAVATLSPF
ncbi:MAG TPA: C40 family peptidase, partial [Gaiellales bacterium]|nr:C40 family peptidase [Gaiellales bacterium]